MTPDRIAALRRLIALADPPLPWRDEKTWKRVDAAKTETDAAIIMSAVNALPELLDAVDRLQADNARLRAVLAEVEWCGGDSSCPSCGCEEEEDDHAADCALAAALRGGE